MIGNWLRLGPVTLRVGSRHLAPWGFPRLQIGGLSVWTRSNTGDIHLLGYHPKSSITWLWYVGITRNARGYASTFSKAERDRMARLFVTGNPYASFPRWWHRFVQPARVRRGQWHDYARLPFGRTLVIGWQAPMGRR